MSKSWWCGSLAEDSAAVVNCREIRAMEKRVRWIAGVLVMLGQRMANGVTASDSRKDEDKIAVF